MSIMTKPGEPGNRKPMKLLQTVKLAASSPPENPNRKLVFQASFCQVLLMEEFLHQFIGIGIPLFSRLYTSQVVQDFHHQYGSFREGYPQPTLQRKTTFTSCRGWYHSWVVVSPPQVELFHPTYNWFFFGGAHFVWNPLRISGSHRDSSWLAKC